MNKHTNDADIISMTTLPTPATAASEHTGVALISGLLKERELVLSIHFRTIFRQLFHLLAVLLKEDQSYLTHDTMASTGRKRGREGCG